MRKLPISDRRDWVWGRAGGPSCWSGPNGPQTSSLADRERAALAELTSLPSAATRCRVPSGAGYFTLITPSQGRAGGADGRRGHARLGLDWCDRLYVPHGEAASFSSSMSMNRTDRFLGIRLSSHSQRHFWCGDSALGFLPCAYRRSCFTE
jgi:hypothetical protein